MAKDIRELHIIDLRIKCLLLQCHPTLVESLEFFVSEYDDDSLVGPNVKTEIKLLQILTNNKRAAKKVLNFNFSQHEQKDQIPINKLDVLAICGLLLSKELNLMKKVKCCEKCEHQCTECQPKDHKETTDCYKKPCKHCGVYPGECRMQIFIKAIVLVQQLYEVNTNATLELYEDFDEDNKPFARLKYYKSWSELWHGVQKQMVHCLDYLCYQKAIVKYVWKDREMDMRIVLRKKKEELIFLFKDKLSSTLPGLVAHLPENNHINPDEEIRANKERRQDDNNCINQSRHISINNSQDNYHDRFVSERNSTCLNNESVFNSNGNSQPYSNQDDSMVQETLNSQGSLSGNNEEPFMELTNSKRNQSTSSTIEETNSHMLETAPFTTAESSLSSRAESSTAESSTAAAISYHDDIVDTSSMGNHGAYGHSMVGAQAHSNASYSYQPTFATESTELEDTPEYSMTSDFKNKTPMYNDFEEEEYRSVDVYNEGLHLCLIRGLPGSGKTFLAEIITQSKTRGVILATDNFFLNEKDEYVFDPTKLPEAHEWNQEEAKRKMLDKVSPICIDNTNTQAWEMRPYVKMAEKYQYVIHIIEASTDWAFHPKELSEKTSHNIGRNKIDKMLKSYEKNVTVEVIKKAKKPKMNQKKK